MQCRFLTLALTGIFFLSPQSFAQGDDCSSAIPIQGVGTWLSNTQANSTSGFFGAGTCGPGLQMGHDAFYEWTASADGDFLFDTTGASFLGAVAVYAGAGCAATCVEGFSPTQAGTGITVSGVMTGDTFLVQVGIYSGDGTYSYLTVSELSDACLSTADDAFEDNDGCSSPRTMAPGHYSDLVATANDSDFYSVVVPINHRLDVLVSETLGDVDFLVLDSTCALLSDPFGDFSYTNDTGSNQTIIFEAYADHYDGLGLCANYSLDIAVTLDPCLAGFDDFMEDNDTCSTPLPLAPGTYSNLWTGVNDSDFFAVTIPRNSSYSFTLDRGYGVAAMRVFHSDCSPRPGGTGVSVNGSNPSSTPLELIVEVYSQDHPLAPGCGSYDLTVDTYFDPCPSFVDDSFEPNNSCQTSTRLVDGTYPNLQVHYLDADFYWFCVGAGATLNLDVLFTHADGNVDIGLWEKGRNGCGTSNFLTPLLLSTSVTDNESLSWVNDTGMDIEVAVKVSIEAPTALNCNSYDLVIQGRDTCGVFSSSCGVPQLNSTGLPTLISGVLGSSPGSGLHLEANQGPAFTVGYFLIGSAFAPSGATLGSGKLCLSLAPGEQLGRYNTAGSTLNSLGYFNSVGRFISWFGNSSQGFGFDVPSTLPFGGSQIVTGQTWHFQLWHRDNVSGVPTSNLSDALHVSFP